MKFIYGSYMPDKDDCKQPFEEAFTAAFNKRDILRSDVEKGDDFEF